MTLSAMTHRATQKPALVQSTGNPDVVIAQVDHGPWTAYPAAFFVPLEVQGPSVLDAQLAESARVAQTVQSQAPASPAMQEALRRGFFRSATHAFVDGAEWAAVSRPVPTRHTILGDMPVDENTVDFLDNTITDLREHMIGMRDRAEAQDVTAARLHHELSAAHAKVRDAEERLRLTRERCQHLEAHAEREQLRSRKAEHAICAMAETIRGSLVTPKLQHRNRLKKSLKNV